MENIKKLILENNLIKENENIGVAVSGGKDSMALLCYLNNLSKEMNFSVIAITVSHGIRVNGEKDADFVMNYCKKNEIKAYKFNINSLELAKERGESVESAARYGRYNVFETMLKKHIVDKIAVAHHRSDQAETILMHLFRGSGITGLKGMSLEREDKYIRPMLYTGEKEILEYIENNNIPYVQDETNLENEYNRNFIRNEILPLIEKRWPNAINAIINFSNLANSDDNYIYSQVPTDLFLVEENQVKIPLSYFIYDRAITSRMLYKAMHIIGVNKDIENKHIDIILSFVLNSQNGKKLELPLKVCVYKEYDYLTIVNKAKDQKELCEKFKIGSFNFDDNKKITVKKVNEVKTEGLFVDADKIPKNAIWRFRKDGDIFEKFGGGTKKLKEYFIDKKIPARLRNNIPVLADEKEVYIVAGIEISNKVKIDNNTVKIYQIL